MSLSDARFADKPLADEACKTGGMARAQADVFVQVKQFDACPIDGRSSNHAREEFDLCRSGCRYDSSLPPLRNCLPNSNDGVFGRGLGGKLGGSQDALCHGAASRLVLPHFNPALREMPPGQSQKVLAKRKSGRPDVRPG